jgi:hypothetical protein
MFLHHNYLNYDEYMFDNYLEIFQEADAAFILLINLFSI